MIMTLEWAIQHLCRMVKRWRHFRSNGTAVSTDLLSIEALELISDHLETARWRKLSEEQPTEHDLNNSANKTLQVWRDEMSGYSFIVTDLPGYQFNVWTRVTHWRPIVGPEIVPPEEGDGKS